MKNVHMAVSNLWHSIKDETDIPEKTRFDPIALGGHLQHVFLCKLEILPTSERFLMKVHGTAVNEILSRDLTNCYLDEILPRDRHTKLTFGMKECVEKSEIIYEEFNSVFPGREFIRVSRICCPLYDTLNDTHYILGSLARNE